MADTTLIEAPAPSREAGRFVDFDLHGIVGLRLVEADARDRAAVLRQVGPIEKPLDREPDIVVRFVDRMRTSSRIRYLGLDDAGFTDDAFLVLKSKHKARTMVQIPFDQIGNRCEIVCDRGLPAVPHLLAIMNLTALARGALPLHASAFRYNGVGVLTTGWAKGGKTESLLAFMSNGGEYVGDEWVYLSADGKKMYGIPEPIRLWKWHLDEVPRYRALIGTGNRLRLGALDIAARSLDRRNRSGSKSARLMRRLALLLQRQQYVQMPPRQLFGVMSNTLVGVPQKVFLVASHETPDIEVQEIDPQEVARRMVFSLQEERIGLLACYHRFRFAFPEMRNELLEGAEELQRATLLRVLDGKETYAVYHPYPVPISDLFESMRPYV
jgi:hypothetical protein